MILFVAACAPDLEAPPTLHFDHEACDGCGMLVGDPAHAAAIVTRQGETLAFDDPACLFRYVADHAPSVVHLWFHDGVGWHTEAQVAFRTDATSPMGSGLQAVPAGTPGAISVGAASNRVMSR